MAETFVDLLPVETGFYTNNENGQRVLLNSIAQPTSLAWSVVDDPVTNPDGDTSIVRLESEADTRWSFKFQKPSAAGATNVQSIVSATIFINARRGAPGGGSAIRVFWHTAAAGNADSTVIGLTTSYAENSRVYTTNPFSTQAWDPRDFESQTLEAGAARVDPNAVGSSTTSITQIYLHLVYNPATWSTQPPLSGSWSASPASGGGWVVSPAGGGGWTVQ